MTKLHRLTFYTIIYFISLIIFTSQVYALFDSNVDKAKEFMQAGMYLQAITLLEKEINDNPTNAEAHFQLGVCYVNQNNYSSADERFSSAVRLKPDYGYQIGEEYKRAGEESINNRNNSKAKSLFSKAIEYQPNLKKEIAPLYFEIGKAYLDQHRSDIADEYLSLARNYGASLGEDIRTLTQNYGKQLLDIAKNKPKEERKKYIDEARKYVRQESIDAVLPPPTWQAVYKKTFTGIGYKGGNGDDGCVLTAKFNEDIEVNDRIIIYGKNIEVWSGGDWKKYKKPIFYEKHSGGKLCTRAPKGEEIIVEIQRLASSY